MKRKIYPLVFMIMVFSTTGCIKETYDMNKLSKKGHLSPTMAVSAIKGIVSFSDMVKAGDTVLFGQDKSVKLIFKMDSVIDLSLEDFISLKNMGSKVGDQTDPSKTNQLFDYSKSSQLVATISPDSIDFKIDDILNNITGTFGISNPSITIKYSNPFVLPVELELNVTGKRKDNTVDLNLSPFSLNRPAGLTDPSATGSFRIDKNNSSLPGLVSMPPGKLYFSGKATMNLLGKTNENDAYVSGNSRLIGSLEVEIPLEFRMNNFQFTDTVDNFLKDNSGNNNIKPEDFKLLRVKLIAKNGFPLGISLSMSLFDTINHIIKSTVDATGLLNPAPVDANGKSTGVTETTTSIEFTQAFFSSINNADKIIFKFTLNTTDGSTKDIKIYSDYTIDYNAALVAQPDITFK
jgi:hypothetical protein